MGKGYTVGIASETKAFKQGIDTGLIAPLEDADKALLDLGKNKGPEKLERELEQAQKASKTLERETEKTADAIEQEYRKAYKGLKQSADDGYRSAGDAAQDFKNEASSSAREAAATFDGSAESIGDAFQEVAANAFTGFGPAGAAAGLVAAAGLGVVFSELTKQQEAADELKAKMADMYRGAVEEGRTYLDEAQVLKEMQDIMWNPDRVDLYNALVKDSKDLGLDLSTVLAANAGDREKVTEVQTRINALMDDEMSKAKELSALELAQGQIVSDSYDAATTNAQKRYEKIGEALDGNTAKAKESLAVEESYTKSQLDGIQRTRDASAARYQAQADALGKTKTALDEMPKKHEVKFTLDDTALRNYRPSPLKVTVDMYTRDGKRID